MEHYNMDQINEVYAKLGICVEDPQKEEATSFRSQNAETVQFGIYTKDGFGYTNNTNFPPQNL